MDLTVNKNSIIKHVSYPDCEYCDKCAELFKEYGLKFSTITCDKQLFGDVIKKSGSMDVPQIILNGEFIGGYDELVKYLEEN